MAEKRWAERSVKIYHPVYRRERGRMIESKQSKRWVLMWHLADTNSYCCILGRRSGIIESKMYESIQYYHKNPTQCMYRYIWAVMKLCFLWKAVRYERGICREFWNQRKVQNHPPSRVSELRGRLCANHKTHKHRRCGDVR